MRFYVRYIKELFPRRELLWIERLFSLGFYKQEYTDSSILFVHIPKNAGVFFNLAIYGKEHLGHNSARFLNEYDREYFSEKYSFCFSRNPYSRFISAFNFLKQGGADVLADPRYIKLVDEFSDINDFVSNWLAYKDVEKLDYVFRPQTFFVCSASGEFLLDDFFRLEDENFNNVAEYIYKRTKIELNFCGQEKNISRKKEGSDLNMESKRIIQEKYKKDFEVFGYEY